MPEAAPRFASELKRALPDHSIRRLAKDSGWGRSTVHEWMSGVRLPNPRQLDDLLDVGSVAPGLRRRLHELRDQVAGPADGSTSTVTVELSELRSATTISNTTNETDPSLPDDPVGSAAEFASADGPDRPDAPPDTSRTTSGHPPASAGAESGPAPRTLFLGGLLVAALLAAGAFGAGYLVGRGDGPVDLVAAEVIGTGGEGILTRQAPTTESAQVGSVEEGAMVEVICVVPNGESVYSEANGASSSVWALLADGSWTFDLYLTTPKAQAAGEPPPAPLKLCGDL
ncbi:helix-turn-helix domain-containing protein [Naumannella halotolerans]|uniref:Helix-turn-helix protein n=1 Tax=Naumannella halotolerans TaxID=993414 RepID=A0A4R7J1R9_9ACTN|nr:helix-turn-helix transcriptional regulator [Naumannella halotolerans]TDT31060.1 hypothetical protein CLV29_2472 [Naumannella halotolerans]